MTERPLILITNDDGIGSPLLTALADTLAADVDVLVVAPERQRSAISHSITLHKPLRCRGVAPGRWSLSGTPVDCVYVGLMRLAPRPPALVVSGPNDGYNLGSDVFYSGTVAGAVEGGLRGLPALAVSLAPHAPQPAVALRFVARVVKHAIGTLPAGEVLSVNLPGAGETRYAWTALGRRHYVDDDAEVTNTLRAFCRLYFHGHSVGGTNPSLLEAMANGSIIVAHDNEFNRAVLKEDAYYFKNSDDVTKLVLKSNGHKESAVMVANNFVKIEKQYNWPNIVNMYEEFIIDCYNRTKK